ncbi:hypothetical protein [Acinetobacter schindleri]|uniref:hypothetical protein n=1 Tax=Acinetobacter schindleri TaxID=108981 RepID=UPI0022F39EF6|nr:hypothetical protein [Acinetobacter schindleri]WBX38989.1 hypothetical protein MYA84_04925 [Acinetobacter schindleri]
MRNINYKAALPTLPLSGHQALNISEWLSNLDTPTFEQRMKKLFANGEQGFWYDPSDMGTMFQDAAGTVPVTAVGQAVGLILDKSGRGNHAFQTTSASRPILRKNAATGAYYLGFDGTDDFLVTNGINFTATDKISLFAGLQKLADTTQIVAELSPGTSANAGSFYLVAGSDLGGIGYTAMSRGSFAASAGKSARNFTYLAPDTAVLSVKHDISGDLSSMRRNGVVGIDGTDDKGAGNFGNYPLYIGRRGGTSLPFNGHIYNLIGVGRLATVGEIAAIEKELTKRTGVLSLNV